MPSAKKRCRSPQQQQSHSPAPIAMAYPIAMCLPLANAPVLLLSAAAMSCGIYAARAYRSPAAAAVPIHQQMGAAQSAGPSALATLACCCPCDESEPHSAPQTVSPFSSPPPSEPDDVHPLSSARQSMQPAPLVSPSICLRDHGLCFHDRGCCEVAVRPWQLDAHVGSTGVAPWKLIRAPTRDMCQQPRRGELSGLCASIRCSQ